MPAVAAAAANHYTTLGYFTDTLLTLCEEILTVTWSVNEISIYFWMQREKTEKIPNMNESYDKKKVHSSHLKRLNYGKKIHISHTNTHTNTHPHEV